MSTFGEVRNWGSDWKAFISKECRPHQFSGIQKTTLPGVGNYLDLDPVVKDAMGMPVTRITARYRDNESALSCLRSGQDEQWYREAGAIRRGQVRPGQYHGRQHSCLWRHADGQQQRDQLVNQWGFAHEAPNLGILGGSWSWAPAGRAIRRSPSRPWPGDCRLPGEQLALDYRLKSGLTLRRDRRDCHQSAAGVRRLTRLLGVRRWLLRG